jgi:pre-rRNA-processing protein TSR1
MTGYVRHQPMCVNSLVHIPGWGDFRMSRIHAPEDPHPLEKGRKGNVKELNAKPISDVMDEDERVLEIADPAKQVYFTVSLNFERVGFICFYVPS